MEVIDPSQIITMVIGLAALLTIAKIVKALK